MEENGWGRTDRWYKDLGASTPTTILVWLPVHVRFKLESVTYDGDMRMDLYTVELRVENYSEHRYDFIDRTFPLVNKLESYLSYVDWRVRKDNFKWKRPVPEPVTRQSRMSVRLRGSTNAWR